MPVRLAFFSLSRLTLSLPRNLEKSPCAYAKAAADLDAELVAADAAAVAAAGCCPLLVLVASLDGSGEAVSPAARERFDDDREGDDGAFTVGSL